MHVDLLPSSIRNKVQLRAALRRWSRTWAVLVAVCIAYCCIPTTALITARHSQEEIASRCEPLKLTESEIATLQGLLASLTTEKRELEKLKSVDHTLDLLNVLVQAAKSSGGQIQLQKLGITITKAKTENGASRRDKASSQTGQATDAESSISLHGVADGESALSQFVESLRQSNVFNRVDLRSTSQFQSGDLKLQQYQLDCRLGALP
jgi:Tfp pilus assembly protein PilN